MKSFPINSCQSQGLLVFSLVISDCLFVPEPLSCLSELSVDYPLALLNMTGLLLWIFDLWLSMTFIKPLAKWFAYDITSAISGYNGGGGLKWVSNEQPVKASSGLYPTYGMFKASCNHQEDGWAQIRNNTQYKAHHQMHFSAWYLCLQGLLG